MEEESSSAVLDGEVVEIRFGLATHHEIEKASISGCPINHVSQLTNPFLGLPLEFGKCESCGTSEPGKCEGHFGYIELPVPVYHPSHVSELRRLLNLLCLKCLKIKKTKSKSSGLAERLLASCCEDAPQVSVHELRPDSNGNGPSNIELRLPSRSRLREGCWSFMERYGYRYGHEFKRPLLPAEVKEILKRIPGETRKKLAAKGFFLQDGYIIEFLPVPPNCLSVPDVSDGFSSMSSDPSRNELKDVLRKVEVIKSSRSGRPNFESHMIEANDLYSEVDKYLRVRGTAKASRNIDMKFGVSKDADDSATKAWLEKMRTLFIRKGSGFSSRSVITGDAYKRVNEVGIPHEIAQRITFEERVSVHNIRYLQNLVDDKLCLSYMDGATTYSLREGSKGHTFLRPGQVVHRRIMDGDVVFINRPPTTHKHSLQALSVYVHEDHTVKINPLICGPLSADFDGDCVHLFYPQSLAAKAEVLELFSVEKQLLSSHSGQLNLQLATDSLLSLKVMFERLFMDKATAQQLAMYGSLSLPLPALRKAGASGSLWTALQILQLALPENLSCRADRYLISGSDLLWFDSGGEAMGSVINEIVASVFFEKGAIEVLRFFDCLQPLLMEHLFCEGFSVSLEDLSMSRADTRIIHEIIQDISPLLSRLRLTFDDELQLENSIQRVKEVAANFMLKSYSLRNLIDIRSDSSINKLVQQIGFLGLQLSDKKKFYSKSLVEDMAAFCQRKYPGTCSSAEFGLVKSCFFHGLDPYEEMAHAIATREVIVRSSKGLAEPGTLFKNLMAVLRDIVISYDGTVRNTCSNSIVQFMYEGKADRGDQSVFSAGEPVGVLAATAMSNPAYKAVLDSTPNSNSSWELMKEILLCKVNFQNVVSDRRVIVYLNECGCGKKYCLENAACSVKNQLKKISLKDAAMEFMIEYKNQQTPLENSRIDVVDACLVGHVHLDKELDISMHEILQKCQESIYLHGRKTKKKKKPDDFKGITLSVSECCSFQQSCADKCSDVPCLMFSSHNAGDKHLEETIHVLSNTIYPALLETIIKGDPRICSANIVWNSPEMTTWIRNPCTTRKGEWVLDVVVEKSAIKKSGDAWRIVVDSCLPVLHLIDTRRSIPYAIKQVQELLGISCAFEQAVQRLSASVRMVSKGVLKEHLILLANSMTCSGNMVGFNSGGYKALTRALNIQAPFTEATLITPRRCFERAAEKCHTDSLSSVVGSCSWGKHVAVGTGSRFDLLWNQKEVGLHEEDEMDVYSFLNMVRSTTEEEAGTACLGVEIDDLVSEEDMAEWAESPEHDMSVGKPVFEDSADFQNMLDDQSAKSKWESNGWEKDDNRKPDAWSSWNSPQDLASQETGKEATKSVGWDTQGTKFKPEEQSVWNGNMANSREVCSPKAREESSKSGGWEPVAAWGSKKSKDNDKGATAFNDLGKPSEWSGWEKNISDKDFSPRNEDTPSSGALDRRSAAESSWGQKNSKETSKDWGSQKESSYTCNQPHAEDNNQNERNSWGSGKESSPHGAWNESNADDKNQKERNCWGSAKDSSPRGAWNQLRKEDENQNDRNPWGSKKESNSQAWNQPNKEDENQNERNPWGSKESNSQVWNRSNKKDENENERSPWGLKESNSQAWNQPSIQDKNENERNARVSTRKSSTGAWNQPTKEDTDSNERNPWGSVKESSPCAWDQPNTGDNDREDKNPWASLKETNNGDNNDNQRNQWGNPGGPSKKYPSEGNRGWGKGGGDWKGKKNRPAKSPGLGNQDSGLAIMLTVTGQRLDMFTSEEQDILLDVEPVMKSISKIRHQPGYNDGDPLSADDQSFVLEKVLNYHPDKERKIGAGIDYVMVSKHSSFVDSRCFYIVSTDGSKQDFSYIKCLDNFIKGKYPDLAQDFVEKYFRKPRSGGNRDRKPPLTDIAERATPDVTEKSTPNVSEKPTAEATEEENAQ